MILYWYCEEKFCLDHSWELLKEKNLSSVVENAILPPKYKKVLEIINEMCDILKWNDEKAHRKV